MMTGAVNRGRRRGEGIAPLTWPKVEPSAPAAGGRPAAPPAVRWIEAPAFASLAGPEATRLFGMRFSLRPAPTPPAAAGPESLTLVATAETAVGRLTLGMDRHAIASALERMFGAVDARPVPAAALHALAPASSSWTAFARLIADALGRALGGCNLPCTSPPSPAGRIGSMAPAAAQDCQWFALDLAGTSGWLALTRSPAAETGMHDPGRAATRPCEGEDHAAGRPPTHDGAVADRLDQRSPGPARGWRARAAALARTIELPVGVRIAELRLPLDEAMRLQVGSILPIDRPRLLMLSVDGVPWRPVATPQPDQGGERP